MCHYNTSEHRAWKYGPALAAYVASQPSYYAKNIAAHSMGNIVAGSALLSGMSIDNYALLQAAVPAGCYDAGEDVNSYGPFLTAEASTPTPDWADARGYRARLAGVTGNLVTGVRAYNLHSRASGLAAALAASTSRAIWVLRAGRSGKRVSGRRKRRSGISRRWP